MNRSTRIALPEIDGIVLRALDALADDDPGFATSLLENLHRELVTPAPRPGHVCATCGVWHRWPGQLADHVRNVHGGPA